METNCTPNKLSCQLDCFTVIRNDQDDYLTVIRSAQSECFMIIRSDQVDWFTISRSDQIDCFIFIRIDHRLTGLLLLEVIMGWLLQLYPLHNEVVGGYIGFTPSVHLSIRRLSAVPHAVSAL